MFRLFAKNKRKHAPSREIIKHASILIYPMWSSFLVVPVTLAGKKKCSPWVIETAAMYMQVAPRNSIDFQEQELPPWRLGRAGAPPAIARQERMKLHVCLG